MSKMSELHSDLETIRRIMEDDCGEPEPLLDYLIRQSLDLPANERISLAVRILDEVCAMAKNGEVGRAAADQILVRAQLVASLFVAHQPRPRVVSNNG